MEKNKINILTLPETKVQENHSPTIQVTENKTIRGVARLFLAGRRDEKVRWRNIAPGTIG